MVNNSIPDLFTRIRNGVLAGKSDVTMPYSRLKLAVCRVLEKEGYLGDCKKTGNELLVEIAYKKRKPVITHIRTISRPGLRVFRKKDELPKVLGGAGIAIVSTSKGVMTGHEAVAKSLGGEVLGEVW